MKLEICIKTLIIAGLWLVVASVIASGYLKINLTAEFLLFIVSAGLGAFCLFTALTIKR